MPELDSACEMVRQGTDGSIRALTEELNPTLYHFFSSFSSSPEETSTWMEELLSSFFLKLEERKKPLRNSKLYLLLGAVKLIKNKKTSNEFLEKIRTLPYEELLIEPLPETFFSDPAGPTREYCEWFRANQLSSSTRLLLDLLFLEGIKISEFCRLFQISEAVMDPFLFTFFHRLSQEPELPSSETDNELELFHQLLEKDSADEDTSPGNFAFCVSRLKSMFRIDLRQRLSPDDLHWLISRIRPDEDLEEKKTEESPSVISSIRRKNEEMQRKQESESAPSEELPADFYRPPPQKVKDPQEILKIVKPAVVILLFFLGFSFYRTLDPPRAEHISDSENEVPAAPINSLTESHNLSLGSFTDSLGDHPVQVHKTLMSNKDQFFVLLANGISAVVSPYSRVRFHSSIKLEILRGEVLIENPDPNLDFETFSQHGAIRFSKSSIRFSKWYPSYSVAGVHKGNGKIFSSGQEFAIQSGEEVVLGLQRELKPSPFSSRSFERPKSGSHTRPLPTLPLVHHFSTQLDDEVLKERLLERKEIEGNPTVKQKDFWHKL